MTPVFKKKKKILQVASKYVRIQNITKFIERLVLFTKKDMLKLPDNVDGGTKYLHKSAPTIVEGNNIRVLKTNQAKQRKQSVCPAHTDK